MNLSSILTAAAAQAQTILAPIAEPTGEGEFTLSGADYTGTFNELNETDPLDATGIRRIRILYIFATKAQFDTAPSAATRTTLTAKGATWTLAAVTDLPQHYRLVCKPA